MTIDSTWTKELLRKTILRKKGSFLWRQEVENTLRNFPDVFSIASLSRQDASLLSMLMDLHELETRGEVKPIIEEGQILWQASTE